MQIVNHLSEAKRAGRCVAREWVQFRPSLFLFCWPAEICPAMGLYVAWSGVLGKRVMLSATSHAPWVNERDSWRKSSKFLHFKRSPWDGMWQIILSVFALKCSGVGVASISASKKGTTLQILLQSWDVCTYFVQYIKGCEAYAKTFSTLCHNL